MDTIATNLSISNATKRKCIDSDDLDQQNNEIGPIKCHSRSVSCIGFKLYWKWFYVLEM
jgi:hypothetical protein